ncbi:hypothetical protein FHW37_101685 [Neorhizobium alkalisoli]|uniref:Uncharacterized protein n=1 Tax=Neorhizobium alkalisoli TaxID=528178 RepID=A0A561R8F8_9HYPH|nr:hypothetical protein FHW37_101685 [Neorhizobium alkalisoli]
MILPSDDAFLIVLYLVDVEHRDLYPDRPPAPLKRYTEGSICLISLDQGATIAICGRFEAILFHFPRRHLTEPAEKAGEPLVKELAVCRGVKDQTIADLGAALLPILHAPSGGVDRQALPYICLAFSAHIAHRYGRPYHPH